MPGKRVKKRRSWLPAVGLMLVCTWLLSAPMRSAAADSPLSGAAAEPVLPEQEPIVVQAVPDGPGPEDAAPSPQAFAPVPESDAVDDTYFEDAAFLGDSRTEGFQLYSGLQTGTYYDAVGATVESVFTKDVETDTGKMPLLDAMAGKEFGKIYVMLGVNELGWNKVETFSGQYAKLVDRLREDHPDAVVILQSILPVSAKQEEKKSYVNNARIALYNEAIRRLAEEKGCPFVDVAEAVTDESGCLRAEWNSDGVHLNVAGCQAWLAYLRTHPVK